MIIVKQKCIRLLNDIQTDKMAMEDLIKNNEKFVKKITEAIKIECSAKQTIKQNNKWKKDYEKQSYKFMSRENIYKSVVKILNNKYQLLTDYTEPLISFSNSYYKGNKHGVQDYMNTNIFNYILFWNGVNELK